MGDQNKPQQDRSRRECLDKLVPQADTNAALWLRRFPEAMDKGKNQEFLASVCAQESPFRVSKLYRAHYDRWKQLLEKRRAALGQATVQGRMIVGLGAESVLETSIVLHPMYGVPMIPGSALKGLASSTVGRLFKDERWKQGGESHKIVFGEKDGAGYVTFHDALFVPPNDERLPLDLDVMTVHHRAYYGTGDKPPADWDSPVPVPFLTARGDYLIALEGPMEWVSAAWQILQAALAEEGIGAKTAAGYGRMKLGVSETAEREKKVRENAIQQIERLKNIKAGDAQHLIRTIFTNLPDDLKPAGARAILFALGKKWEKANADKPWVQILLSAAGKP